MKILFSILVLIACLSSCSIEHHLAKAQKHIDIAKRKGAIIKPDTVWHYKYETITEYDTLTNTFREKQILRDSFPYQVTNTISAGMTRQERLAMESYFKHMEKLMKLQNDSLGKELKAQIKLNGQNQKTERVITRQENKTPWAWIIIPWAIIILFLVFKFGLKYIKSWIN